MHAGVKQQGSSYTRSLRIHLATSISVLGLVFVLFLGLIGYKAAVESGRATASVLS